MRVTTAFNNLLGLPGASVSDVCFSAEAVVVSVRLRRRRRVCAGCGQTGRWLQIHDRRVKRWRHLDLGASRCIIEYRRGGRAAADPGRAWPVLVEAPQRSGCEDAVYGRPAPMRRVARLLGFASTVSICVQSPLVLCAARCKIAR